MSSSRSLKLKLLGGLAGLLLGVVLVAVRDTTPGASSPRLDANDVVGTLAGGSPAGGGAGKLSERADALSGIIEVRLRAKEFDKALDLLRRANDLELGERDQVYEKAANVVLKPAPAGGDEKDRETYLAENGGKAAVLDRLPLLYRIVRQVPDSPVKVTLLLRMRNVYDFADMGGDRPPPARDVPVRPGDPGPSLPSLPSRGLPRAESLMEEASRIAHALPSRRSPWLPWAFGGALTIILGFLGVVLGEMLLEGARCVAQEIARGVGLGRPRETGSAKDRGTVAVGTDRVEPAPRPLAIKPT